VHGGVIEVVLGANLVTEGTCVLGLGVCGGEGNVTIKMIERQMYSPEPASI
jgi:hypothetical protein